MADNSCTSTTIQNGDKHTYTHTLVQTHMYTHTDSHTYVSADSETGRQTDK